jgi:DNA-binding IclR family transcriptional regulator
VHALQVLVDEMRDRGSRLSLSELSRRMGLAHSTVSGIVTRLERR